MRSVRNEDATRLMQAMANPADAGQRRRGRFKTHLLQSQYGPVLDLSRGGVRVRCGRKPGLQAGDHVSIELRCPALAVEVRGHVRWLRKTGWFSHEAGIQFDTLTPTVEARLRELFRVTMDDRLPGSVMGD